MKLQCSFRSRFLRIKDTTRGTLPEIVRVDIHNSQPYWNSFVVGGRWSGIHTGRPMKLTVKQTIYNDYSERYIFRNTLPYNRIRVISKAIQD